MDNREINCAKLMASVNIRNLYSHTVWRNVKLTARQIIFRQTNYLRVEFFSKKVDLTELLQQNHRKKLRQISYSV